MRGIKLPALLLVRVVILAVAAVGLSILVSIALLLEAVPKWAWETPTIGRHRARPATLGGRPPPTRKRPTPVSFPTATPWVQILTDEVLLNSEAT